MLATVWAIWTISLKTNYVMSGVHTPLNHFPILKVSINKNTKLQYNRISFAPLGELPPAKTDWNHVAFMLYLTQSKAKRRARDGLLYTAEASLQGEKRVDERPERACIFQGVLNALLHIAPSAQCFTRAQASALFQKHNNPIWRKNQIGLFFLPL